MIKRIKERINDLYVDSTIPHNNIKKRFAYAVKQRITKEDFKAFQKLRALQKVKKDPKDKIKVVFLLQMPEIWEKQKLIYEEMCRRIKIEPIILAIPKYDIKTGVHKENVAYEYAIKMGYKNVIFAKKDNWFDLSSIKPDYVFYQRPYEEYLPEIYRSRTVLCYAKTCYIPYAIFASVSSAMSLEYERGFARNIYYNFVGNKELEKLVRNKFRITSQIGLRKIQYLGLPILENILKRNMRESDYTIWETFGSKEEQLKVLWTPRWTTDEKLGGSHFFDYVDEFTKLVKNDQSIFFVFRPHPMAFDNYIRNGLMSKNQIMNLKQDYKENSNMLIDGNQEYIDTFAGADVLITDISSMMMEFFVTGKPIIFCGTNMALDCLHKEVVETLYCVNTWEEIEKTLYELKQGNDLKKDMRRQVIRKNFENMEHTSVRIVDAIECDC